MEMPESSTEKRALVEKIYNKTNSNFTIKDLVTNKIINSSPIAPNIPSTLNLPIKVDGSNNNKTILLFESNPAVYTLALQLHKDTENQKLSVLLGFYKNNAFTELLSQEQFDLKIDNYTPRKTIPLNIFIDGTNSKFEVEKEIVSPSKAPKKTWKFWKR
jgi:hypothetical protein